MEENKAVTKEEIIKIIEALSEAELSELNEFLKEKEKMGQEKCN